MIRIRRDHDIHAEEGGWFHARWHFSFDSLGNGGYLEPGAIQRATLGAGMNGQPLGTGDAAQVPDEPQVALRGRGGERAEVILVDVPLELTSVGVWAGR